MNGLREHYFSELTARSKIEYQTWERSPTRHWPSFKAEWHQKCLHFSKPDRQQRLREARKKHCTLLKIGTAMSPYQNLEEWPIFLRSAGRPEKISHLDKISTPLSSGIYIQRSNNSVRPAKSVTNWLYWPNSPYFNTGENFLLCQNTYRRLYTLYYAPHRKTDTPRNQYYWHLSLLGGTIETEFNARHEFIHFRRRKINLLFFARIRQMIQNKHLPVRTQSHNWNISLRTNDWCTDLTRQSDPNMRD